MANPNWARWIEQSVAIFLKEVAEDTEVVVLIDGVDERQPSNMKAQNRLEVRLNGPFSKELSKGYHRLYVDVNVLLISQMGGQNTNPFRHTDILGLYHEAMDGPIPISRYGTGPDDDADELLGCLTPRPGNADMIRVLRFAQIDKTDRIKEGMVDARYVMYLTE
jgi:hypothetical protein